MAGVQVWRGDGWPAGISQRDVTQRFPELPAAVEAVEAAVLDFHEDHVMAAFPLLDCESLAFPLWPAPTVNLSPSLASLLSSVHTPYRANVRLRIGCSCSLAGSLPVTGGWGAARRGIA